MSQPRRLRSRGQRRLESFLRLLASTRKRLCPTSGKNADLAVDVAAMTTDGGVLLYGVAEDEHGRPTVPRPMELAGTAERVGQIVASSISEVPTLMSASTPARTIPRGAIWP